MKVIPRCLRPLIMLRLYGSLEPWLNKIWRPNELELVN